MSNSLEEFFSNTTVQVASLSEQTLHTLGPFVLATEAVLKIFLSVVVLQ